MTASILPRNRIKIAYADDHNVMRKALVALLNAQEDCEVVLDAPNGKKLIEQMEKTKIVPDICILDYHMPELDGLDTLCELKKRWDDISILFLSQNMSPFFIDKGIRNGANGYLDKSCEPEELYLAIRSIYDHGIYNPRKNGMRLFTSARTSQMQFPQFTKNEIDVMKLCCSDLSYDQIASEMRASLGCVEWSRNSLFKKLHVKSRSGLVLFAIYSGLVNVTSQLIDDHIVVVAH